MADDIRARLGLCCYTCHEFVASETKIDTCVYCGLSEWIHHYRRDVDALLTENAALEEDTKRVPFLEAVASTWQHQANASLRLQGQTAKALHEEKKRIAGLEKALREAQACITKHHDINTPREWGALCPICVPVDGSIDIFKIIDAALAGDETGAEK